MLDAPRPTPQTLKNCRRFMSIVSSSSGTGKPMAWQYHWRTTRAARATASI